MIIVAFDPGKEGGIARTDGESIVARPLPLAGDDFDLPRIAAMLQKHSPAIVAIEKVNAMPAIGKNGERRGMGVTGAFNFGRGYGSLLGICAALGIRVELVAPQTWKAEVLRNTPKDKDAGIAYLRRAWPELNLLASPKCRKPHLGIVDASCIAIWAWRKFGPYSGAPK